MHQLGQESTKTKKERKERKQAKEAKEAKKANERKETRNKQTNKQKSRCLRDAGLMKFLISKVDVSHEPFMREICPDLPCIAFIKNM